ncbi:SDR family NAD(P)-dependent oxidoreductase [Actinoallomurus iriomotensis]|uniref:3-oxoacyl-ACP reductase n=1 Tax=Actinoallomurus iriomotensis TaxID=478107 RepID=A0A9W6RW25_9ACTN|nr:SDR family oxidoreductase [Actinoallomurus iriomotensis]GLY81167.1 3-oxoacyl-ACP reductase [Actinoallomurus iriomotensis]
MNSKRVALVSGAGRGIGAATARELGRLGYHVIVNYLRDAESAKLVVEQIGDAQAISADVTDEAQVTALVDRVVAEHGRIDVLVGNANTVAPPFGPLEHVPWEAFEAKVSGELAGLYHLTRRVLPVMRRRRSGRIVYVSATAAELIIGSAAHSTAKAAVNAFVLQVAGEAIRDGVTVNAVAPGAVGTDATAEVFTDGIRRHFGDRSVTGTMLRPQDLARPIAALVDGAFAAVTGQVIPVDGGYPLLSQLLDGLPARFRDDAVSR